MNIMNITYAKMELVQLLEENGGFRCAFEYYLKEAINAGKKLAKGNHSTIYYDFKNSKFTTYEFTSDNEHISGEDIDLIRILDIKRGYHTSIENTIKSITKRLNDEIEVDELFSGSFDEEENQFNEEKYKKYKEWASGRFDEE